MLKKHKEAFNLPGMPVIFILLTGISAGFFVL